MKLDTIANATYFATIVLWIALLLPAAYLLLSGDYFSPIAFYGQEEDSELVAFIFDLRDTLLGRW